jgi:ketosteroid isomerase-like protein
MIDQFAVQETINRYSVGASRADWDAVVATFTPDGVWEVPVHDVKFEGREAVRGGLKHFSGPMEYIVQSNSPAVIDIDGDTARAVSVIRECGKFAGQDAALEILGHYVDTLVRTPEGWRFKLRVFELQGMHSFPLLPAAAT